MSPTAIAPTRHDIPLRVAVCGNQRWSETLKTAWSSVAEQPLQIDLIDASSISAEQWQAEAVKAISACDVAVVPAGLLPALDDAQGLMPLNDGLLGEQGVNAAAFYPVLREGLMKYGGRTMAVPLGAVQPVLVTRMETEIAGIETPQDWESYIEVAKKLPSGQVAEPLGGGAAAQMFLWRANSSNPPVWLFDRQSFAPVIDTQPYVDVLETMKRCVDLYGSARLTAGDVWSQLATGKLRLAIGWPAAHSDTERIQAAVDCEFAPLPKANMSEPLPLQTLAGYESPIAVVSSHCRQSAAAARFISWLTGGDGTSLIRDNITGITELRPSGGQMQAKASANAVTSTSYSAQLGTSLMSLSIRPPLQLLDYRKYADILDNAVLSYLNGKQTAQAAMTAAAKHWTELTDQIGIKPQSRAWRRAQGLRS